MNTWENTFTVRGLFRTKSVLDMADYVAVWLADKEMWQVLKCKNYASRSALVNEQTHQVMLANSSSPIILESNYLARDEEGLIEW